jgi:Mg-chelatase subunit ChlD
MLTRDRIAAALAATLLSLMAISQASARQTVEVAFVLDTTGSMGPLIEGAKRKIWSIATSIFDANPNADIRIGLVAYRDIGDDYVTKRVDLTADIQELYAKLLDLHAQGGGDWPESVNEALDVAVNKLSWSRGSEACRILFLIGDAPPHMDSRRTPNIRRRCRSRSRKTSSSTPCSPARPAIPSACGARLPSAATAISCRSPRMAARSW